MSQPASLFDPPEPTGKSFSDGRLSRPFTTVRGPTASALLGSPTTSRVPLTVSDTTAAFAHKAEAWQRRMDQRLGLPGSPPSACSHGFTPIHPDGVRRCSWCHMVVT